MLNLPEYDEYGGEKRIALMDNSTVAFMEALDRRGVSAKVLLREYDIILVPGWVQEEICDSEYRKEYINALVSDGYPIYGIREERYSELAEQEEGKLYQIVLASVKCLGPLRSYLNRNVAQQDILDLPPYEEWISKLYENWPISGGNTAGGRERKKNAGEVSLTILAEIYSWYYPEVEALTVYTQDADSYYFQREAQKALVKSFGGGPQIAVTFRSNDSILFQLYKEEKISLETIQAMRTDSRFMIYTQKRSDETVALIERVVSSEDYVDLICDSSVQIIF